MKRLFLIIFSSLIFIQTFAQIIRTDIDFFSWNENIKHTSHVRYIYGGGLLIIRHFAEGHNWEMIQSNDSTFSYFQYDSTLIKTHYTATLTIAKDTPVDTIVNFHPHTFETYLSYQKIFPLVKHGLWEGKEDSLWLKGNYKNGVKVGEWSVYHINDDRDFRKRIYDNGKIIYEQQLNLVKTLPIDSIKNRLIGDWCCSAGTYGSDRIQLRKINCYKIYIFSQDTLKYTITSSPEMYKNERRWFLNDDLELVIDDLKYRIVYFLEDEDEEWIELERIGE